MDHTQNTNNNNNKTSEKSLEALDESYQIFLIILYSFTACFAFISNLLTIIVMWKGKRCTRDLRKFLINLSIADLLMAMFTIPFTYTYYMFGHWIFVPSMCSIVNFAQLTTITVSIYTLVAIAIDRYMAIMHPLKKSKSWFKRHRTLIVILIWLSGLLLGLLQFFASETKTFIHNQREYISCDERWKPESMEGKLYTAFIFATTFALPMLALCIIYTAMGWKLFRYRGPEQQQQQKFCLDKNFDKKTTCTTTMRKAAVLTNKLNNNANDDDDDDVNLESESIIIKISETNVPEIKKLATTKQQADDHFVCLKLSLLNHRKKSSSSSSYYHRHHSKCFNCNGSISSFMIDHNTTTNQRSSKLINIRRHKVLKMLIIIIMVFTVCWLPIQLFNILIYFKTNFLHVDSEFKYYAFVGSYFFCHWISMAHSFMNPIIYSFMSKNFRSDMKMIFSNVCHNSNNNNSMNK
ncbi:orexin receptor type 2-like isoform X1 [Dermatophagoides farinae]|uniref:orexin receptor type 2-like isoform X1 n=2 Tax=Dermatophagoides farinae TaxID=6954 RepID=UPI003F62DCCD